MSPTLPLYYWADQHNFGDELSLAVVEWISGYPVRAERSNRCRRLFAVGSILERAREGDVIWGAGIHPWYYDHFWKRAIAWKRLRAFRSDKFNLNVLAVRGPLTRDALLFRGFECPEIFGDPAILLPLIYPKKHNPTRKIGVVPHYSDKAWFAARNIDFIDVAQPWKLVVDQILESEVVIATSLHGIIVAEAYGVPAIWHRTFSGEGIMKYADYYLGTDRMPRPEYSYEQALLKKPDPSPNFSEQRKLLIDAFSRDVVEKLVC